MKFDLLYPVLLPAINILKSGMPWGWDPYQTMSNLTWQKVPLLCILFLLLPFFSIEASLTHPFQILLRFGKFNPHRTVAWIASILVPQALFWYAYPIFIIFSPSSLRWLHGVLSTIPVFNIIIGNSVTNSLSNEMIPFCNSLDLSNNHSDIMASESDGQWDVFLSFRGEDTRNNFTSHLYTALHQKGIRTFIDDELRRGEQISEALLKAIEESRISIIVISENYPSSSWCLDELLKSLECKKKKKQMVLPVFYKVDPSDVRKQKSSFGKALAKLEDKVKDDFKMQEWRDALHDTANLSGWHLGNGNESKFIQSVVEVVLRTINRTHLNVAKYPVGIDTRVQDINLLLNIEMNDIHMVGIFGVGGIGKTTIAKAIYNLIADQFEGSCFLANVRETSKRENGLVQLQETMLCEILGDTSLKVLNTDRGICVLKKRLSYKKVLLVLDDVDQLVQLEALAGGCEWFGLGSRIIITTRDKGLLTSHEVDLTYEVKELDWHEAFQLFSWYAFRGKKPTDDYVKLTEGVISYARGLPLALTMLGSDMCGRSIHDWKSALDKYKRIPNQRIQEILKISYDGLDDNEKNIFLDVACFFKGERADYVTKILDSCDFFPDIGIRVLVDKCLITIEPTILGSNVLWMHDLVQEMGREIVRKESPKEPGKRSRLWFHEDVVRVLKENMGTNKVEGILVDLSKQDTIHLSSKTFLKMRKLRLFINRNAKFFGRLTYLPNDLRLLDWPEYPSESLPSNFHPKKLVVLRMPNSLFKELAEGFKNFQCMTIMDFSRCVSLTKIPDLSGIPNLEALILDYCTNLVEVHDSVGFLEKLVILKLHTCSNLRSFPRSLKLRSLEYLCLNDCSRLENFPEIEVKMEHIGFIGLQSTPIKELPSSIGNLVGVLDLCLEGCKNLTDLPSSIPQFQHLRSLNLGNCSKLVKFSKVVDKDNRQSMPSNVVSTKESEIPSSAELFSLQSATNSSFSNDSCSSIVFPTLHSLNLRNCILSESDFFITLNCISTLETLDLSENNFVSLPACISRFAGLRRLTLTNCKHLQEILKLPPKIKEIEASGCISLERFFEVSNRMEFSTCELPRCEWIDLSICHKLFGNIGNDMENLLLGEGRGGDCKFGILYPGSKIPGWFSHRQEASDNECDIHIKEPLDLNGEIIGMALCAVIKINDINGEAPISFFPNICSPNSNIFLNDIRRDRMGNLLRVLGSDHVWLFYVPESNELKGEYRQVEFWVAGSSLSLKSCGVHLVCRYGEKAKETVNQYTNLPQEDDGVDFPLDVPNEDNLESILYPQQKRFASIYEVQIWGE